MVWASCKVANGSAWMDLGRGRNQERFFEAFGRGNDHNAIGMLRSLELPALHGL